MLTLGKWMGIVSIVAMFAVSCSHQVDVDSQTKAVAPVKRYIVSMKTPAAENALMAANAQIVRRLPELHAVAAYLPEQAVLALSKNPNIEYIEEDLKVVPLALNLPYADLGTRPGEILPYGIQMVQADQVTQGSNPIKVCIIDSGYNFGNEDLSNDLSQVNGSDTNIPWDVDNSGHGTHVAGTISALAGNGKGVVGVAPLGSGGAGVSLHIVRVFGDDGNWAYSSDLIDAAYLCRDAGAKVISMSLGRSCPPKLAKRCISKTEEKGFKALYEQGILSIAAASNDGNSDLSYPASYTSVISVAAIDKNGDHAGFSNTNEYVELSAPGVEVLSTIPIGHGLDTTLTIDGASVDALPMGGSPIGVGTGVLADCGDGQSTCEGPANGDPFVCLIQRGTITFADKVLACEEGGGVAAIIYNNVDGNLAGTVEGGGTLIPSIGITKADGLALIDDSIGLDTTITIVKSDWDYAFFNGTSMATPHVASVAALIWSNVPSATNVTVREALQTTAVMLGDGDMLKFGHGLIQAKDALEELQSIPTCTPTENPETSCSDGIDNDCDGTIDSADSDCVEEPPPVDECDGLLPVGASCTTGTECCSDKCVGKPGAKTCK